MKTMFLRSAALIAIAVPSAAHAQSTGSIEFDEPEIVVTAGTVDVDGIEIPDTAKAKQVLAEEIIRRQRPGQTVNDIVNLVPGVSFQNNDPWGSSGGGFTIRGFGADRVSQTLDGLPLNDSGNYALYTNQQVDSEVLASVNVNLGTTDVDSPTASAAGGTINIRTRTPTDYFHITSTMSYGNVIANGSNFERPYARAFGMVDTGDFTGMGTKAYFSASYTTYENPFNNYGEVSKQQYNGKIYQEIGSGGDFVSISGHYNQNRNNFFGSQSIDGIIDNINGVPISTGPTTTRTPDRSDRFYDINFPCNNDTFSPGSGVSYSDRDGCGAEFDRRYNPSNTGNIRGASLFHITDALVLSVDPSYQYVKANGGGPEDLREGFFTISGVPYTGFIRGGYYYGRDLNGDGDILDRVAGNDPSQTRTDRYGVISSLSYEINPDHRVRVAYTHDNARHRQTGETSLQQLNGEPTDVFSSNDGLVTADGFVLNKRDRLSYAILNQVSGEYRGRFGGLTTVLGLRAPFFTRELNQNCYTTSAGGFLDCIGDQDPTAYEAANPNSALPTSRTYKYDKLLPNVGFTYQFSDASVFGNYAKGLSVPGTDPLYDSLFFADSEFARPVPETTNSFDLGLRYQTGNIQAQIAGWYTQYDDRLASAFDPDANNGDGEVVFRNLGRVDKYGIDASVAWNPTRNTLLYVFGSINESEIKENVQDDGVCDAADAADPTFTCTAAGQDRFFATAGKRESGAPTWSIGARGQVSFAGFEIGTQVKHTGKRFVNDVNDLSAPSYTLVDFDLRYRLGDFINGTDAAIQVNVSNVFDEYYVGFFGGGIEGSGFAQIGSPRAASISLILGY